MLVRLERGPQRGSFISAKVYTIRELSAFGETPLRVALVSFYFLFPALEEVGRLDPDSDIDLNALASVFPPRNQSHLDIFHEVWCNHPICTAHNRTTHQLWILGIGQAHTDSPTYRVVQELAKIGSEVSLYYDLFELERGCISIVSLSTHQGVHEYGIDWDGPITMDEDNTVTVPDLPLYVISEQHISKHILREELTRHPLIYMVWSTMF